MDAKCKWCRGPILVERGPRGRPAAYCSPKCAGRAYNARRKERKAAAAGGAAEPAPRPKDPLTGEPEYDSAELEFLKACDRAKRAKRRGFLTCVEVLGVAKALGYRKAETPPAAGA